ncbi:unnamed protein product, partial [marine sediment metagenome]
MSGVYRGRPGGEESSPGIPRTNLTQAVSDSIRKDPKTGEITIDHDLSFYYLDSIDKGFPDEAKSLVPSYPAKCGLWAIVGEDEDGNRVAKRLFC